MFYDTAIARMIGFPLHRTPQLPHETACTASGETEN